MLINGYSISNTRDATHRNPGEAPMHRLRVRDDTGQLICELFPALTDPDRIGHSDPWKFVRANPQSKARASFIAQMKLNGISDEDLKVLLAMPKKK